VDPVFAWKLVIMLAMLVIEYGILRPLENHLFRWRRRLQVQGTLCRAAVRLTCDSATRSSSTKWA